MDSFFFRGCFSFGGEGILTGIPSNGIGLLMLEAVLRLMVALRTESVPEDKFFLRSTIEECLDPSIQLESIEFFEVCLLRPPFWRPAWAFLIVSTSSAGSLSMH